MFQSVHRFPFLFRQLLILMNNYPNSLPKFKEFLLTQLWTSRSVIHRRPSIRRFSSVGTDGLGLFKNFKFYALPHTSSDIMWHFLMIENECHHGLLFSEYMPFKWSRKRRSKGVKVSCNRERLSMSHNDDNSRVGSFSMRVGGWACSQKGTVCLLL